MGASNTKAENRRVRRQKARSAWQEYRRLSFILLSALACCLGVLFQSSTILSLNAQVSDKQQELSDVQSEIDSKEGQLISGADLKNIEAQARALGMTEATSSQYIYETSSAKNLNNQGKQPGLYEYLSMFRQIREGNLWP